nr:hypothetical protein [Acidisphaera sp. S103]
MIVEGRRQIVSLAQQFGHAIQRGHDPVQCLRHHQDDTAAGGGNHRDIAAELQRVAVPLLRIQQHRLTVQRLPGPERLGQRRRGHRLDLPASFVFPETFLQPAHHQQRQRQIAPRLRIIRPQRQRFAAAQFGLLRAGLLHQHQRQVALRPSLIHAKRQSSAEQMVRFSGVVEDLTGGPEVQRRIGMVRPQA